MTSIIRPFLIVSGILVVCTAVLQALHAQENTATDDGLPIDRSDQIFFSIEGHPSKKEDVSVRKQDRLSDSRKDEIRMVNADSADIDLVNHVITLTNFSYRVFKDAEEIERIICDEMTFFYPENEKADCSISGTNTRICCDDMAFHLRETATITLVGTDKKAVIATDGKSNRSSMRFKNANWSSSLKNLTRQEDDRTSPTRIEVDADEVELSEPNKADDSESKPKDHSFLSDVVIHIKSSVRITYSLLGKNITVEEIATPTQSKGTEP